MVKKLKGKATEELKGKDLKKRLRQYEEAKQLWLKLSPLIIIIIVLFLGYFTYQLTK